MRNEARYVVVVVGIIVLGGGVAGASAYTGRAVTTRLSEQMAVFSKLFPRLQVEEKLERGLFRSTRTIKVQLGCVPVRSPDGTSVEKSSPIALHWRDTVHHVPFLSTRRRGAASIDSELEIEGSGVEQVFGTRAPLSVHTDVEFDGRFGSEAKLAAFTIAPKPGEQLVFTGMTMHLKGTFPEGAGTFSYSGTVDPLQISAKVEDGTFTAGLGKIDLEGSADIDPAVAGLLLPYRTETRVADVTMQFETAARDGRPATHFKLALQGVVGKADSTMAGELYSTTSHVQGSLKTDSFSIDKFEIGAVLRNLHAPTYTKLTEHMIGSSFSCEEAADPLAELETLATTAAGLLPYNPEYEVGPMAIEVAGKRAELSYAVGFRGLAKGVEPPPLMEIVMKHGFARAEAKVHLGLIDQMVAWGEDLSAAAGAVQPGQQPALAAAKMPPGAGAMLARAMLDGFVQQGYLEREAESVRGRVEFDAGAVKLNGKPFELPNLSALGAGDLDLMKGLMEADDEEESDE